MRAAILHRFGDVRVEEVPDPVPRPGEVVIDVACVQPSVTECMLIAGEPVALHGVLASALARGPIQFGGHEFSGVISDTGGDIGGYTGSDTGGDVAGTPGYRLGDRVTAVETITCGACAACRRARPDACAAVEVIGFTRPGAFAERIAVPAACLVRVPAGVSAGAAAAIQPLAGALHAHALAAVQPGETVLVLGAGVMGLLGIQVARHGNAGLILVTGRSPAKLALAQRLGAADMVLDASTGEDSIRAAVLAATDGIGADVVIDTAGGPAQVGLSGTGTLELAARCVRRGGRIVMVSVLPEQAAAPLGLLRERSISLLHPRSGAGGYSPHSGAFEHALRLVARGDVDVESLVTHRLTGIAELPKALAITGEKATYGAINPAQVELAGRAW